MKTRSAYIVTGLFIIIAAGLIIKFHPSTTDQASVNDGWKSYTNPTIGLGFNYPSDWRLFESGDPVTHGDILKEGKMYTTFSANINPLSWSNDPTGQHIMFAHGPYVDLQGKSYDNLPVSDQLNFICDYANCIKKVNKNGVAYVLETYKCGDVDCSASATVPTGKYIIGIYFIANYANGQEKNPALLKVFNQLVDSITLE